MHVQIILSRSALACAAGLLLIAGCKKTADDTGNYKQAINTFLSQNQSCLWQQPVKFPVQVNTSDADKTASYDALYNQGLLARTSGDKKQLLGLIDKQVTNYDLTPKGQGTWKASAGDPSYGNFCYGHREVSSIDQTNATGDQPGATASVAYHYDFSSVPDWAKDAGVQNAFPNVKANLAGGAATATLVDTNGGWQVQIPARGNASNTDGSVVQ